MNQLTTSVEETKALAAEFANTLVGGDVVFLRGDLGAGKTTFVQGLMEAFGYKEPVRSPTFSLVNIHPVDRGEIQQVAHIDLYRLKIPSEVLRLGLDDLVGKPSVVTLVEWPNEEIEQLVPSSYYEVRFERTSDSEREIIMQTYETKKR